MLQPTLQPRESRGSLVGSHLLTEEGEIVIDEVRHHWVVYIRVWLQLLGVALLLYFALLSSVQIAWVFLLAAGALTLFTAYRAAAEYRDRFVITNMRVMRVRGVFTTTLATTPISRILDITVRKPFLGRLLGYGHFVFESAAQEQGFREIRYVGQPYQRDLVIQRVIQRAGLRSLVSFDDGSGDGGGESSSSKHASTQSTPARVLGHGDGYRDAADRDHSADVGDGRPASPSAATAVAAGAATDKAGADGADRDDAGRDGAGANGAGANRAAIGGRDDRRPSRESGESGDRRDDRRPSRESGESGDRGDLPGAGRSDRDSRSTTIFNSDNPRWDEHPRPR